MTQTSFAAPVALRTGKINKNGLRVFERGENLLQNLQLNQGYDKASLNQQIPDHFPLIKGTTINKRKIELINKMIPLFVKEENIT